jgi:hypothetical protein
MNNNLIKLMWALMFAFSTISFVAQVNQNTWSLPPNRLATNMGAQIPLPDPPGPGSSYVLGTAATANHNAMRDAQGNLLFFIVDQVIYDSEGYYMSAIDGPGQEICIVPDPGNCQRYYIFYARQHLFTYPYYSILDFDLTNTSNYRPGDLVMIGGVNRFPLYSMLPVGHRNFDKRRPGFAASTLRPDNTRLIFMHNGIDGVYRFKLSATGLVYEDFILVPGDVSSHQRAEVELIQRSNGNYRLACASITSSGTSFNYHLNYMELDPNGGLIPGNNFTHTMGGTDPIRPLIYGLEFSPNGNFLYFTHQTNATYPNAIQYINWSNPTSHTIHSLVHSQAVDFQTSQIEYSPINNRLYFPTNNRFATLFNPNSPNIANYNNNFMPITYTMSSDFNGGGSVSSYTMPDQIDGMNYTDHFFANISCCLMNRGYDRTIYPTVASATWSPGAGSNPFGSVSGTVRIEKELVIKAGHTITINNMRFEFAPGAKVVIERSNGSVAGGKLIMGNNTVFTVDDTCDDEAMWLGVQVYGHSNQAQTPTGSSWQGQLIMNSGSRIEHALKGAAAARYTTTSTYPYAHGGMTSGYTGGIIQATGATFYNNVIDVELRSYIPTDPPSGNNVSSFTSCNFITEHLLNDPSKTPQYHIYLNGVKGVVIQGCTFENIHPLDYSYFQQGIGIYSGASGFTAKARCTGTSCATPVPNLFKNLYRGIHVAASISGAVAIDRNTFTNNIYGVVVSNSDLVRITRNNFQVYRSKAPNLTIEAAGVSLTGSTSYRVEENSFTEFNAAGVTAGGNTYGVIVSNSGEADNEIYKNTFTGIRYGIRAQGINAPYVSTGDMSPPTEGLQMKCNTFNNTIFHSDISITSNTSQGRIALLQGRCVGTGLPLYLAAPAGNKFSHSTVTSEYDLFINPAIPPLTTQVQHFTYSHHVDAITTPANYSYPTGTLTLIDLDMCNTPSDPVYFHNTASCPSRIIDGVFGPSLTSLITDLEVLDMNITSMTVVDESIEASTADYLNQQYLKSERNNIITSLIVQSDTRYYRYIGK